MLGQFVWTAHQLRNSLLSSPGQLPAHLDNSQAFPITESLAFPITEPIGSGVRPLQYSNRSPNLPGSPTVSNLQVKDLLPWLTGKCADVIHHNVDSNTSAAALRCITRGCQSLKSVRCILASMAHYHDMVAPIGYHAIQMPVAVSRPHLDVSQYPSQHNVCRLKQLQGHPDSRIEAIKT